MPVRVQKIDLAELRTAAEKATPGPWEANERGFVKGPARRVETSWGVRGWRDFIRPTQDYERSQADARHIANCDPQTILTLIQAIETARGALDQIEAHASFIANETDASPIHDVAHLIGGLVREQERCYEGRRT